MTDISHKIYIFSLKSVGRLVRWSPLLTLSPEKKNKNQNSTRRSEIRIKFFTDSIRSQQPKLRAWIFRVILRDRNFGFCKKHTKSRPKFRLSGNRWNSQSFGRKKITVYRNFSHFYCISLSRNLELIFSKNFILRRIWQHFSFIIWDCG
jgi:hypothetical protein